MVFLDALFTFLKYVIGVWFILNIFSFARLGKSSAVLAYGFSGIIFCLMVFR